MVFFVKDTLSRNVINHNLSSLLMIRIDDAIDVFQNDITNHLDGHVHSILERDVIIGNSWMISINWL